MIQKGLYKVGDSPQKGDRKRGEKKELYSNPNCSDTLEQSSCTHSTFSDGRLVEINILALCLVAIRSNTSRFSILEDLVLRPILYKFIVLGSLDQDSI